MDRTGEIIGPDQRIMPYEALEAIRVLRTIKEGETNFATAQIANPAASYCVETGGSYEMRQGDVGVVGICILTDGAEMNAWQHFRAQKGRAFSARSLTHKRPTSPLWPVPALGMQLGAAALILGILGRAGRKWNVPV